MIRPLLLAPVLALAVLVGLTPSAPSQDRRPRVWCPAPLVVYGPPVAYPPGTVLAAPAQPEAVPADRSVYAEALRRQDQKKPEEFNLFRAFTPPIKLARVLPERERARYLILAMPNSVLVDPELARSYVGVIRGAVEVTDVLVLVPNYSVSLRSLTRLLEREDLADRLAPAFDGAGETGRGMIHVVPLPVNTLWVRDYGPVFASTADGKLCVLDSMYRDLRLEQQNRERQARARAAGGDAAGDVNSGDRPDDDRMPTVLATTLNSRMLNQPVGVVRTPL
jgi:hypothetical protein